MTSFDKKEMESRFKPPQNDRRATLILFWWNHLDRSINFLDGLGMAIQTPLERIQKRNQDNQKDLDELILSFEKSFQDLKPQYDTIKSLKPDYKLSPSLLKQFEKSKPAAGGGDRKKRIDLIIKDLLTKTVGLSESEIITKLPDQNKDDIKKSLDKVRSGKAKRTSLVFKDNKFFSKK